jgi:predicted dehydrogenase
MAAAVRIGVAGVGSLGRHHARLLGDLPGARLVGIHDTDAKRLAEVASELSVPAFGALEALLEGVEALVVAVPTVAHEMVARAALQRGVHVLIEKPIAPSLEAADRILEAAERGGALVQIGHVERFNGALRACEPYLEEPLFVESHRLAPFVPRGTDVPVVLDLMIHDLDLVLSLVGRPVRALAAVGVPVLTPSPDIANARLEFEGGAVANLTASRVSVERMRKIRFFQRSGYISLDLAAGVGEFLRLRPGVELVPGRPLQAAGIEELVERIELRSDGKEPLRCELESFIAAVQGRAAVAVTGTEARDALAVALEIVERIEEHVAHRDPT